jgi:hypothetical protein
MAFRDLKLEAAAEELARLATETASQRNRQISLDGGVRECAPGHGDRANAVEFVAQVGKRHRLA